MILATALKNKCKKLDEMVWEFNKLSIALGKVLKTSAKTTD